MSDELKARVQGFSLHDAEQMQDPYPFYAELRNKCPVGRSDQLGGFYVVSRYDDVRGTYSNYRDYSSAEGDGLPPQPIKLLPIDLDPPLQTKYRRILNPEFTPEVVATHRARIEAIVNALIDDFIEDGAADLVSQLIRPSLAQTVLPIIGVPGEHQADIAEKLDYVVRHRHDDPDGSAAASGSVAQYLVEITTERRESAPKDDILQVLINSAIDGEPLSNDQIFRVLLILLFGGLDTTSSAMGEALVHLARNPADADRLRNGEVDWAGAVEEFVRYASPIQGLRRTLTRDIEVEGVLLKQGQPIVMLNGSANRDPSKFDQPDRCVIERGLTDHNDHVAFGAGAHICLGRDVARLALEILLDAVITRMPDFRLGNDFVPIYPSGEARGLLSLPVTFSPAMRQAA